jgi:WD40 repeat protein
MERIAAVPISSGAAVAVARGGKLIAIGTRDDGVITIYDPISQRTLDSKIVVPESARSVGQMLFVTLSPAGRWLGVALYDAKGTRVLIRQITSEGKIAPEGISLDSSQFGPIDFLDASDQVAVKEQWQIRLVECATGKPVRNIVIGKDFTTRPAFDRQHSRMAIRDTSGVVHVFDVATGDRINTIVTGDGDGSAGILVFAPDGKSLASFGACHRIRVWDVTTGQEDPRTQLDDFYVAIESLAVSPDGKTLAAIGKDGEIVVRDSETGARLKSGVDGRGTLGELRNRVNPSGLSYSDKGNFLLSPSIESEDGIDITDASTHQLVGRGRWNDGKWLKAAISPDGKLIATRHHYGVIHLWGPTGQHIERIVIKDGGSFSALAFSADSRYLLYAYDKSPEKPQTVCPYVIYNIERKEAHKEFLPKVNMAHALVLSNPKDNELYLCSEHGIVQVWSWTTATMTREFKLYFGSEEVNEGRCGRGTRFPGARTIRARR